MDGAPMMVRLAGYLSSLLVLAALLILRVRLSHHHMPQATTAASAVHARTHVQPCRALVHETYSTQEFLWCRRARFRLRNPKRPAGPVQHLGVDELVHVPRVPQWKTGAAASGPHNRTCVRVCGDQSWRDVSGFVFGAAPDRHGSGSYTSLVYHRPGPL